MDISGLYKHIVSITQFNKGKASQLFSRVNSGETLLVIKNNTPVAVILSPEEYEILRTFPRACRRAFESENNKRTGEVVDLLNKLNAYDESGEQNV